MPLEGNMSNTLGNVYAAEPLTTGVCFVAPLLTPGPTDALVAVSTLSPNWVDLGYTGTEGFMEKNDRKITLKRSFGGGVVKTLQDEYSASLDFVLQESLSANVLKAVFGSTNVIVTAATSLHGNQVKVFKNSRKLPHQSWIIDTWDDEMNAKYRNYVGDGQITTLAEIKVVHTDIIEYKVTLECFETTGTGKDNIVTFTDDGKVTGS
jgi:hypothetical protein